MLQRDVDKRLGCGGQGAEELKNHPFFTGVDWVQVYQQKYPPPLIPPRGEVNAADAFDIGSFDEEDTKGLKLTEADQELYKNFPLVISERWQNEVSGTYQPRVQYLERASMMVFNRWPPPEFVRETFTHRWFH